MSDQLGYLPPVSYIPEVRKAWEECGECGGSGIRPKGLITACSLPCLHCHGLGGKWHPDVAPDEETWRVAIIYNDKQGHFFNYPVTRSSRLIREHQVCWECGGKRTRKEYIVKQDQYRQVPCPHCLRDENGKPTGAEPGTATAWRVKE